MLLPPSRDARPAHATANRRNLLRGHRAERRVSLVLEQLERRLAPANVLWTGAGGTLDFADGRNWSGGAVPGPADDATISVSTSGPIAITGDRSIHSLAD